MLKKPCSAQQIGGSRRRLPQRWGNSRPTSGRAQSFSAESMESMNLVKPFLEVRSSREMKAIEAKQATNRPVLLDAIEMTIGTIEDRGQHYRNLAVAVTIVWIGSILEGVVYRQWTALTGLILLVPLIGGFLYMDSRRIRHWRAEILKKQLMQGLDLVMFRKTISGFRYLPSDSLETMLSTLSAEEKICYLQTGIPHVKSDEFDKRARKKEWRILRRTSLLTLGLVFLAGAVAYRSEILQLCGTGLMALFAVVSRR